MTFEFLLLLIQWPESLEINSEPGWLATEETAQWAHIVKASRNVEATIHSYFTKQQTKLPLFLSVLQAREVPW